jgi:PAS domain S-box-containing protein
MAFRSGQKYVCNNFFTDPATVQWRERARLSGFKSCICLALREEDAVQGTLNVYAEEAGFFGASEVELLEETAADLAYALTAFRLEERRQRSENMLAGLLDLIPQGVFWKDRQSRYLGCNPVFASAAGLTDPRAIVGKTDFDLPWGPEISGRFRADDHEVMGSGQPKFHLLEQLPSVSGGNQWLDTSKLPLRDSHGTVCGIIGIYSDITARKRMEDELRASRAFLLALMNSTDDLIWTVDAKEFKLTSYNRAFEEFLQEILGLKVTVGLTAREILPAAFAQRWDAFYARVLREGTFSTEMTPMNSARVYWLVLNLVKHGDEVIGISMFGRDITAQKETENRLRGSEQRFSSLVRNLRAGVVTYDPDGSINFCNERALELLGLTREQILGRTPLDPSWRVIRDDGTPFPGRELPASITLATGQPMRDVVMGVHNLQKQEVVWIHTSSETLPGEPPQVITVFHDITKLRADEARLRLQGAALKAAANMVMITDPRGIIQWVNPAFTRTTGYTAAEAIGQTPRFLKSGRQPAAFYTELWNTIRSGRSWMGEMVNLRKDGGHYTQEATITPVHDQSGAIAHFVAVTLDITQQKSLEKQLAQTQRLESIGLLASGIAHDLTNILAPITLSIDLMRRKYPEEGTSFDVIEQCARRGADIIRQVLTFARGMEGNRVTLRLSRLVKEIARLMSETLPRNIELSYEISPAEGVVSVEPTQIHQVLLNLAVNARDAMPTGGELSFRVGNETLAPDDPRLPAGIKPGPYVVLTVADTGHGIPPEILPHIFDPFFTTKPRGQGTGLGLSTVHGIIRSHRGFVGVDTTQGAGTAFHVYLPAEIQAPEKAAPGTPVVQAARGGGEAILVADDEFAIREVSRMVLEKAGFRLFTAENGSQAVSVFRQHQAEIKLVILDRMMPLMDGVTAAQIIHPLAPAVPILLSTGLLTEQNLAEHAAELREAGIARILRKPYAEAHLLEAVQAALASGRAAVAG